LHTKALEFDDAHQARKALIFTELNLKTFRKNQNVNAHFLAVLRLVSAAPSWSFIVEKAVPMTGQTMQWKVRLRQWLPSRAALAAHPWLQPVAGRVLDPQLWRLQHEAVARGVALGTWWAFVLPFGQIVVAVAHCTLWRANIPAAAAMTLVTNPLTIGFWLWLAYQLGAWILGEPLHAVTLDGQGVQSFIAAFGWPTLLGMALFASGGAALGYAGVKLIWRLRIWLRRRAKRRPLPPTACG
jgi:uncharacterized protein (DUF2062 family)